MNRRRFLSRTGASLAAGSMFPALALGAETAGAKKLPAASTTYTPGEKPKPVVKATRKRRSSGKARPLAAKRRKPKR